MDAPPKELDSKALSFKNCATDLFFRIPEEKRNRILETAINEFAQNGYAYANVNRIAETADISVGALYNYFPTKDALFLYIVEVVATAIQQQIDKILSSNIRFLSKLEKLLRTTQEQSKRTSSYTKLYNAFASDNDMERANILAQRIEWVGAKAYYDMISQAQKSGEIRSDIDPSLLAFMLDNQLMTTQFSFACEYYRKRFSMYLGEADSSDEEYVINSIMKAFESMFLVVNPVNGTP